MNINVFLFLTCVPQLRFWFSFGCFSPYLPNQLSTIDPSLIITGRIDQFIYIFDILVDIVGSYRGSIKLDMFFCVQFQFTLPGKIFPKIYAKLPEVFWDCA